MASVKDLLKGEFENAIECCICLNILVDPRVLPCNHSFCVDCIDEYKQHSTSRLICPYCRTEFKLPPDGVRALPKNFFIARLIEIFKVSRSISQTEPSCDVCQGKKGNFGSAACHSFCVECELILCPDCVDEHTSDDVIRHQIVTSESDLERLVKEFSLSFCNLRHLQTGKNFYCHDCQMTVCTTCASEQHRRVRHRCTDVGAAAEDFRKLLMHDVERVNKCLVEGWNFSRQMEDEDSERFLEFCDEVFNAEIEVKKRANEIKQKLNEKTNELLKDLSLLKQKRLEDMKQAKNNFQIHLAKMTKLAKCVAEIKEKGSANEICLSAGRLLAQSGELQDANKKVIGNSCHLPNKISIEPSKLDDLLFDRDHNLMGKILITKESKMKKKNLQLLNEDKLQLISQCAPPTTGLTFTNYNTRRLGQIYIGGGRGGGPVTGVTWLDGRIYVICLDSSNIFVYEDQYPFHRIQCMKHTEIKYPFDIAASNTSQSIFVCDYSDNRCIWKVQIQDEGQGQGQGQKAKKWLYLDGRPYSVSHSNSDELLILVQKESDFSSSNACTYHLGLFRSTDALQLEMIELPPDMKMPEYAVRTSTGHFIVCFNSQVDDQTSSQWPMWSICKLTRDGDIVGSYPSGGSSLTLDCPFHMVIDEEDRVFVADHRNDKILCLNSNLTSEQIILTSGQHGINRPTRVFYMRQTRMFIAAQYNGTVHVFRLEDDSRE